jgi:hypothetical protein
MYNVVSRSARGFDFVFLRERRVVGLEKGWLKSLGGASNSSPSVKINRPNQSACVVL